MRKPVLLSVVLFFVFKASSQLYRGTWLAGGSGSFNSYTRNMVIPQNTSLNYTDKNTNITLSPSVGYFLMDKLSVGIRSSWMSTKGNTGGGGQSDFRRFLIGPFARYYLLNEEKDFNILVDACYQPGTYKESVLNLYAGKYNMLLFMAGPEFFFNSSVGIEVLFGYRSSHESIEGTYNDRRSGFLVTVGFQIHLSN